MHRIGLLHSWLTQSCAFMHLGRIGAVVAAVSALLDRALVLWLTGLAARLKDWARHFQANTITDRTVLSRGVLAKEVLNTERFEIRRGDLAQAMKQLRVLLHEQTLAA